MKQSLFILSDHISIDAGSSTPKYEQIVNQITDLIKKGIVYKGQKLPPINVAHKNLGVSRDTLIAAYKEMQQQKLIDSVHGKGFYIARGSGSGNKKVFMLFDVMNGYKEVLYRSIVGNLGNHYEVDIYFHYYKLEQFEKLISENVALYDYMIVMPHFNVDVSAIVSRIPIHKCLLIDKDIPSLESVPAVFQDFENDIYGALKEGLDLISNYSIFHFISNRDFQFIPDGIISGFVKFCDEHSMPYRFIEDANAGELKKGDLFLLFNDRDLISIIKMASAQNLMLGKDVGIISYDDTPLKEVLKGGITVISTDFYQMGSMAAKLIKENQRKKIPNKFSLIARNSL
ncbi:MAG: GntR family transcriptional regulator [Prolixibacteraceae bacterium]|nr:GntR family transcriptional regulator [Prolixibacteraceae bacterium]